MTRVSLHAPWIPGAEVLLQSTSHFSEKKNKRLIVKEKCLLENAYFDIDDEGSWVR